MTRDKSRIDRRQVSFNDVQVSAANSAGDNSKQNLPGSWVRARNLFDLKKLPRSDMSCSEYGGFQMTLSSRAFVSQRAVQRKSSTWPDKSSAKNVRPFWHRNGSA
jgi:hypothetical protein